MKIITDSDPDAIEAVRNSVIEAVGRAISTENSANKLIGVEALVILRKIRSRKTKEDRSYGGG